MSTNTTSPQNNPGIAVDDQVAAATNTAHLEGDVSQGRHRASQETDSLRGKSFWLALGVTVVLAFFGSTIFWRVLKSFEFPAYTESYVLRGLTIGSAALVVIGLVLVLLWWSKIHYKQQEPKAWQHIFIRYYCYLTPPALVTILMAIPLTSTALFLGGISVDQEFRTQYLTRLTDSIGLSDMNYLGLPTFYPAAWFWFGGRFANLLDFEGWRAFQPWAIVSMATCAAVLTPLWQRITGSLPMASALAVINTILVLNTNVEEPYAAVVILGAPLAVVLANRALHGSNSALVATALYLGASACTYTLYTGIVALSVVVLALLSLRTADKKWTIRPLIRLVIIGVSSMVIAAISWGPYLLAVLSGEYEPYSAATRYLPESGTEIILPMFSLSFMGLLCLGGLIYLLLRRNAPDMRPLIVATLVAYGWMLISMLVTMPLDHSLLGFRLNGMVAIFIALAGVFCVRELHQYAVRKVSQQTPGNTQPQTITAIFIIIFALGSFNYIQNIPDNHEHDIELAYTDSEPAGAREVGDTKIGATYYSDIDAYLREQGFVPGDTVVLTDEFNFLAYFPYRGFQSITAHYANPLGEFPQRNEVITEWAAASADATPQEFLELLDSSTYAAPEVFIFKADAAAFATNSTASTQVARTNTSASWNLDISEDVYPLTPNVRWTAVGFNPAVFTEDSSQWTIAQFGPFAVVTRN